MTTATPPRIKAPPTPTTTPMMMSRVFLDRPELSEEFLPSPNPGVDVGVTGTADDFVWGMTLVPTVMEVVTTTYDEVVGVGEEVTLSFTEVVDEDLEDVELSDVLVVVLSSSLDDDDEVEVEVGSSEEVDDEDVGSSVGDWGTSPDGDGESDAARGPPVTASPIARRLGLDPLTAMARKRERSRIVKAEGHRMMSDRYQRRCDDDDDGRRCRCRCR